MPRTTTNNPLLRVTVTSLLAISCAFAQPREDHSHFEVVSIKPVDHHVPLSYAGPSTGDLGRIVISRTPLRALISSAYPEYGRLGERISGPPWIENEYSVSATIPAGSTPKDIDQMLRNLLTERFGLTFHGEDKAVQGFELAIGQSGFKLTPSTAELESAPSDPGAPVKPIRRDRDGIPIITGQGSWGMSWDRELGIIRTSFHQCTIEQLADMLTSTYGARAVPVADKTEIKGLFDFHLVLAAPSVDVLPPGVAAHLPAAARMRPPDSPDASVIDLRDLSGSLEKQTGLRLKPVKLTLRVMIIDSVSQTPTEN
jgi:uncharacterized protein (TIGR03435 family)